VVRGAAEDGSATSQASAAPEEVDEGMVGGLNPMFDSQFSSVLKDALSRQGTSSLFSGPIQAEAPKGERKPSALEEVLLTALQNSRRNIKQLEAARDYAAQSLVREQKQFERLHFCLKKANSDAAYQHTLEMLLEEKRGQLQDYEGDQQ